MCPVICSVASRREDKVLAELLAKIHEDDMDDLCKSRGQPQRIVLVIQLHKLTCGHGIERCWFTFTASCL